MTTSVSPLRDLYLHEALPNVRAILQLLDRDPLSPTYGCFDRAYWHYRTMDFPSGMSQEFVLPLALVWRHDLPGSAWHGQERLREWVLAGIDFARRSAHRDGSCDDYYPYERALGAAVFSLYAMAEAWRLVGGDDPAIPEFLERRARWVAGHGESGVLTNHHAIAAAALQATWRITGADDLAAAARGKAREVLEHQDPEGWFLEYEGFDPGYQTVTVDFLARYWKDSGDDAVLEGLRRASELAECVQHPDGTFGGEYGSRNTYHTQPHGFEILAPRVPAALRVAERFLGALARGRRAANDDDRLLAHHVYPYLQAWLDHAPRPGEIPPGPAPARTLLPRSGLLVDRREESFLIAGLKKGAPLRAYRGTEIVANDSGIALVLEEGDVLVSHLAQDCAFEEDGGAVCARGAFHRARRERMTPFKSIVLRLVMLTVGRFFRNFVRRLLQRRLILGRDPAPFRFERRIAHHGEGFEIRDTIIAEDGAPPVKRILLGVGQTSIYIAASQPWQDGWLLPWTDLSARVSDLERDGRITHVRVV